VIYSTCLQNLVTVASAVPEWLVPSKILMAHMTLSLDHALFGDIFCHSHLFRGLGFATINLPTKFEIFDFHPLRRYERLYKMSKMRWFGVVKNNSRSLEIAPFDREHMSSY